MVDIRVGIEKIGAWLHNHEAHAQAGHKERVRAARARLDRLREMASDPHVPEKQRFARCFAYLRKIEPLVFEELILAAFRRAGFTVRVNEAYTGDGGIDGRVWIDDWREIDPWYARYRPDTVLRGWAGVQCKRYAGAVQREHLRQFPLDLEREGLIAGFFVHTGTTPHRRNKPTAQEWQERLALPPVRMLSGLTLWDLLRDSRVMASTGQPQVSVESSTQKSGSV